MSVSVVEEHAANRILTENARASVSNAPGGSYRPYSGTVIQSMPLGANGSYGGR